MRLPGSSKLLAPLLLAGVLAVSCSEEQSGGGLLLLVSRDGPLPLDRVDFTISSGDRILHETQYRVPEEASLPTTFGITSNGNPTASVTITVTGWNQDEPLDRRDAIVTQVPTTRIALLKVVLSGRCSSKVELVDGEAVSACGEGNTCDPASGDCTSAVIDGSMLPTYDPEDVSGEGGAAGAGTEAGGGRPSGSAGEGGAAGQSPVGAGGAAAGAGGAAGLMCEAGFDDCDDDPSDCETNTDQDEDNCGECGHGCPVGNGHGYCSAGTCKQTLCAAPLADCNFNPTDGCELDLTSADQHCLDCDQPCTEELPFCTPAGCASHRDIELVSSDTINTFYWEDVPDGEAYRHMFSTPYGLRTPVREGDQGRALLVGAMGNEAHLTSDSLTYAGIKMHAAVNAQKGTLSQIFLYYLMDGELPVDAGGYPLVLTVNAIPAGGVAVHVLELKNVRQLGPIGTGKTEPGGCSPLNLSIGFSSEGAFTYGMAAARGPEDYGPWLSPIPPGADELWPSGVDFLQNISSVTYRTDSGPSLSWASETCDGATGIAAAMSFARYSNDNIALP